MYISISLITAMINFLLHCGLLICFHLSNSPGIVWPLSETNQQLFYTEWGRARKSCTKCDDPSTILSWMARRQHKDVHANWPTADVRSNPTTHFCHVCNKNIQENIFLYFYKNTSLWSFLLSAMCYLLFAMYVLLVSVAAATKPLLSQIQFHYGFHSITCLWICTNKS